MIWTKERSRVVQSGVKPFEGCLTCEVELLVDSHEVVEGVPRQPEHLSGAQLQRRVKGSLRQHVAFWVEQLKAPSWVLAVIKEGYKLPLLQVAPEYVMGNDPSAFKNAKFVSGAVSVLLVAQCIERTRVVPHVCSPLMVVVNGVVKKRLVINLKFLNQYLLWQKFKYENLSTAQ